MTSPPLQRVLCIGHDSPAQPFAPGCAGFPDAASPAQQRLLHCLAYCSPPPGRHLFDTQTASVAYRLLLRATAPCGSGKTLLAAAFLRHVLVKPLAGPEASGCGGEPHGLCGLRQIPASIQLAPEEPPYAVPDRPSRFPHVAVVLCPCNIVDMWVGVLEAVGLGVAALRSAKGGEAAQQAEITRRLEAAAQAQAEPLVFVVDASAKTVKGARAQLLRGLGDGGTVAAVVVDEGDALPATKAEAGRALPPAARTLLLTARGAEPAAAQTLMREAEEAAEAAGAPCVELKAPKDYVDAQWAGDGPQPRLTRQVDTVEHPEVFRRWLDALPPEERQWLHSHCGLLGGAPVGQAQLRDLFQYTKPLVERLDEKRAGLEEMLAGKYYARLKATDSRKASRLAELGGVRRALDDRRRAMQAAESRQSLTCATCLESWQDLQLRSGSDLRTFSCGHWLCTDCADKGDAARAAATLDEFEAAAWAPERQAEELVRRTAPKCPLCSRVDGLAFEADRATATKAARIAALLGGLGERDRVSLVYSDKMQRDTAAELLQAEGWAYEDLDAGSLTKKLGRLHKDPKRVVLLGPGAQQGIGLHQLCAGTMHVVQLGALRANAAMQVEGRFTRMGSTHAALAMKRLRCADEGEDEDEGACAHTDLLNHHYRNTRRNSKRARTSRAA
jgi:energy-converting hydrogenase Eha subunit B